MADSAPTLGGSALADDPDVIRLLFHRKLFLWTHVALASISLFVYLERVSIDLTHALNFRPSGARHLILFSLPAIWPYLMSAWMSRQFLSERRLGFYLFLSALVISGGASIALALGAFGLVTDIESLIWLYVYQTAFHAGISWLLDVGAESPSNNRWRGP